MWQLDWELEPADPLEASIRARPVLERFLRSHTPYTDELPHGREPLEEEIRAALTRSGQPSWRQADLEVLLARLHTAGLSRSPDAIRAELGQLVRKPTTSRPEVMSRDISAP